MQLKFIVAVSIVVSAVFAVPGHGQQPANQGALSTRAKETRYLVYMRGIT